MRRIPGDHAPNTKNRSSKHLSMLTKIRPMVRCMSNEALSKGNVDRAAREIERRKKNFEKTQSRKQKYIEKLEAKRLAKGK